MTPIAKRKFIKLSLPVEQNDEEDLSCVLCQQPKCEYAVVLRGNGRKLYVGIHEKCATPYGVEGSVP